MRVWGQETRGMLGIICLIALMGQGKLTLLLTYVLSGIQIKIGRLGSSPPIDCSYVFCESQLNLDLI